MLLVGFFFATFQGYLEVGVFIITFFDLNLKTINMLLLDDQVRNKEVMKISYHFIEKYSKFKKSTYCMHIQVQV